MRPYVPSGTKRSDDMMINITCSKGTIIESKRTQ